MESYNMSKMSKNESPIYTWGIEIKNVKKKASVKNGIPQADVVYALYNVMDEDFTNLKDKPAHELIKELDSYPQRSLACQLFPWNVISALPYSVGKEYMKYLWNITWKDINDSNFVLDSCQNWFNKKIVDRINLFKRFGEKSQYFFHFISWKLYQDQIGKIKEQSNSDIDWDNQWLSYAVNLANEKCYLKQHYWKKMVDWNIIKTNCKSWKKDLKEEVLKNEKLGIWTVIRLSRSVSWLWFKKIENMDQLKNVVIPIIEKITKEKDISMLIEKEIPESAIIDSPGCLWYVKEWWDVDVFWHTVNILNAEKEHQWNYFEPWSDVINNKMTKMTKEIAQIYNFNLEIWWYFWADYLLVDTSNINLKTYWINEDSIINLRWKRLALLPVEVNWRVTWAYWVPLLKNTYDLYNKCVWVYNTIEVPFDKNFTPQQFEKFQNMLILKLKKSWLLFQPDSDKHTKWIYPFTIMPWKVQVVIVWDTKKEMEKMCLNLRKLVRQL